LPARELKELHFINGVFVTRYLNKKSKPVDENLRFFDQRLTLRCLFNAVE
jgi:hypothetical protein